MNAPPFSRRLFAIFRDLAHLAWPSARKTLRWWSVWPAALFLLICAVAVVYVDQRRLVSFANPWAFAWLLLVPWVWRVQAAGWGGLRGLRAGCALALRCCLVAALATALAEPRTVQSSDALSLVYCLDRSDSIGDNSVDQARAFMLDTVKDKPQKDEAGLVAFARDAAVELPPRQSFPFERFATRIPGDGTDIEQALELSAAVIPEDHPGRIVLISDGVATQGQAERALDQLVARGIAVDVLPVQYDHAHEVWLEKLELPAEAQRDETYEAAVILGSLLPGDGDLVLRENGKEIARSPVTWAAGRSRFTLPMRLRAPGYYEYAATIEPARGEDGWKENNTAIGWIYLQGEGRVLVLVDPDGKAEDSDAFIASLRAAGRAVDVMSSRDCPDDPLSLLPYEAAVLVNVPADELDATQQVAIRNAVSDQGMGLLMVGGGESFGPGGWNHSPVEEALPVTMDITARKVMPKGALVIVLHTCEFADGNTWAKRITKQAIKVLGAKDEVGVVDFDGAGGSFTYKWVFPLTPAGDYPKLVPLIEAAEPSDMPSFDDTFELALAGLKQSTAATKHIIVISDGDPSPPNPDLMKKIIAEKITVSTVTISPHGGQEIDAYRMVAESTGGRSYFPSDPARLPSIFVKEAKTLKRSQIQNVTFTPKFGFPSPILKGIDAVPALNGYVITTPKEHTEVSLEGPDSEEVAPVLAWWRYGTGAAAAFTSDLGSNWAARWVTWDRYREFVDQLMVSIARRRSQSHLRVTASADDAVGDITVVDHLPDAGYLDMQARVTFPDGSHHAVTLDQVAPGRYHGAVPIAGRGRYQIVVGGSGADGQGGTRTESAIGGFAVAYSREYLRFRADPQALQRIADRTGGRVLTGREDGATLFGVPRTPRLGTRPAVTFVLWMLGFLLLLDVAVRRIQLDWSVVAGWFRRKKADAAPTTAAMGALMKAKGRAQVSGDGSTVKPLPGPVPTAARTAVSTPAPKPPAAPVPPPAPGPVQNSTMDRLLQAKRRSQDPKDSANPPKDPPKP